MQQGKAHARAPKRFFSFGGNSLSVGVVSCQEGEQERERASERERERERIEHIANTNGRRRGRGAQRGGRGGRGRGGRGGRGREHTPIAVQRCQKDTHAETARDTRRIKRNETQNVLQCNGNRKTHTRKRQAAHDVSNGTTHTNDRHTWYQVCHGTCDKCVTGHATHVVSNGKRHTTYCIYICNGNTRGIKYQTERDIHRTPHCSATETHTRRHTHVRKRTAHGSETYAVLQLRHTPYCSCASNASDVYDVSGSFCRER